ncbi:hypothetical protein BegalDRAFT_3223 [Beggiatoa alba B18LD]|uniref:DUF3782 domain-containing protein n=1 Tax=Beggiatoa alba B18LD TaxID=395493 RepID=I3CKA1_9GAMM|nr:hypothetical protein [Beggiatoa alba]EIJ44044.1 hypothetical protein BegalDRAFT_3223 [Beggiatoa alba B18LD]
MAVNTEEIWEMFRETGKQIQALRYRSEETERSIKELVEASRETDRRFQEIRTEMAESSKETDRRFQEIRTEMAESSKETDRKIKETIVSLHDGLHKTEKLLGGYAQAAEKRSRELDKRIGALSNRLGEFVEEFIKPNIVPLLQARGIDVHVVSRDVEANNPQLGLAMQIDLLAINGDCCVLIEVKSHLSQDDVDEHIERMGKFKPLFPKYQDSQIFGAVAGMVIPDNVSKYAYRKGFFVITQKHDTAIILNDIQFQPKTW